MWERKTEEVDRSARSSAVAPIKPLHHSHSSRRENVVFDI